MRFDNAIIVTYRDLSVNIRNFCKNSVPEWTCDGDATSLS